MNKKMEKEVTRLQYVTLNVYLLCMLLIDYLEELQYLPVWGMAVKNTGKRFAKAIEHKIIEQQIDRIYSNDKEGYAVMIRQYEKLTKLISTYDPQELEDLVSIVDNYKNNNEEFMQHFKFASDEDSKRKNDKNIV